jgi:hypothetical protein
MLVPDTQQERLLDRLRQAGEDPVAFSELRASGVDFPAAIMAELEMSGYVFERVRDNGRMVGVRMAARGPAG